MIGLRSLLRWCTTVAVIGVALAAAHGPLATALPAPPLDPSTWHRTLEVLGPAEVLARLGRLALVAVAWWSLASILLATVAHAARWTSAARFSVRWSPIARIGLGSWLTAAVVAPAIAGASVVAPPPATMVVATPGGPAPLTMTVQATPVTTVTPTVAPPAPVGVPAASPRSVAPTVAEPATPPVLVPEAAAVGEVHVVERGESFWSIARDEVRARSGPADEVSIARYWLRLIEANRSVLVHPGDPNLLYPGQRLTLP